MRTSAPFISRVKMRTSADTLGSEKYIAAPDGDLKTYPAESNCEADSQIT
jgi:hypothetical protein